MEIPFQKNITDSRKSKYVSTILLLQSFYFTQNLMLFPVGVFHENSLTLVCCTFRRFEIRILTPNRFKNQTNDTLKLLEHNCKYQQEFIKQKNIALHHF